MLTRWLNLQMATVCFRQLVLQMTNKQGMHHPAPRITRISHACFLQHSEWPTSQDCFTVPPEWPIRSALPSPPNGQSVGMALPGHLNDQQARQPVNILNGHCQTQDVCEWLVHMQICTMFSFSNVSWDFLVDFACNGIGKVLQWAFKKKWIISHRDRCLQQIW